SVVRYPGLKPFIREAELKKHERALGAAKDAWATAEKELQEAQARFSLAEPTNTVAARAKSMADLLAAEVTWRNRSNQLAIAEAELEAIRARVTADDVTYFSSRSSRRKEAHSEKSEIRNPKSESLLTSAPTNEMAAAACRAERLVT